MPQVKHSEIAQRGIKLINEGNGLTDKAFEINGEKRSRFEESQGLRLLNPSGIVPTEYNVVVRVKAVDEKTAGGIIIPETTKERMDYASQQGTLIAVSQFAFSYEGSWEGKKPAVGDKVLFAKYGGFEVRGKDGLDYRVIKDKDICAVLSD